MENVHAPVTNSMSVAGRAIQQMSDHTTETDHKVLLIIHTQPISRMSSHYWRTGVQCEVNTVKLYCCSRLMSVLFPASVAVGTSLVLYIVQCAAILYTTETRLQQLNRYNCFIGCT